MRPSSKDGHRLRILPAAAVGAAAGGLSGLFGVGGGILIVPGLVLLLGMEQRRAHATSLAAIIPIAVAGAAGYALAGRVDWVAAGLLTLGSAVGAVVGTRALHRLPERALRVAYAAFLLAAAVTLLFEATPQGARELDTAAAVLLMLVGVVAGIMAGLLGVGGGIAMVPGLVLLLGTAQAVAKGTSLAVIIPTALVGTIGNTRSGDTDLATAAAIGLSGALVAPGASVVAVRLDPVLSAVLFGLLLVAMAIRLLLAARGRPVPGDRR